jgi:mono/diheme cytochrome c family protein
MIMLRKLLWAGLVVGAMLLVASEAVATSTATPNIEKPTGISTELGRRDFRNYCAACHGVDAMGDGTIAEFLTINAPDLTQLAKRNAGYYPREKILTLIDGRAEVKVHGAREMPVWGDWFNAEAVTPGGDAGLREQIVRERIESLVNYIETLQVK